MPIDGRVSFRLRKQIDLFWKLDEQKLGFKGKIRDLSLSGMKLEVGPELKPKAREKITIFLNCSEIPDLPAEGIIRWYKPIADDKGYVCGVKFAKERGADYDPKWRKWMEGNIAQLADASDNKIIGNYLDFEKDPDTT